MNPCEYCIRVSQAEVRGYLAGLDHKNYCTQDETCPCWLLEKKELAVEDTPLIDLAAKKKEAE